MNKSLKRIVISADDFGRSHERNVAIDCAFKNGLVKSAGLLINTLYTKEAIEMAITGGYLKHIHCHLNIEKGLEATGGAKPICPEVISCPAWCSEGEFNSQVFSIADKSFMKYSAVLFKELESQYLLFCKMTGGQGNMNHLDFHFYDNLRWSVSFAFGKLLRKYHISTYRFCGTHHKVHFSVNCKHWLKLWFSKLFCYSRYSKSILSSRIDYYIHRPELFIQDTFELYVHPDLLDDGSILDNSEPIYGKKRQLLSTHIEMAKTKQPCIIISWEDI